MSICWIKKLKAGDEIFRYKLNATYRARINGGNGHAT